jgi:hypothetical protein
VVVLEAVLVVLEMVQVQMAQTAEEVVVGAAIH